MTVETWNEYAVRPFTPYEAYVDAKADLVACALTLASVIEADDVAQKTYAEQRLVELSHTVRQLRDWILREQPAATPR
jgi:hypothetical protein